VGSEETGHPEAPAARLDDRIVGLLERDGGQLAFNGLRRALSAHPESLSRALRRLERFGVVVRDGGGYALARSMGPAAGPGARPELRIVGGVDLPFGFDRGSLYGQLAGRWFGRMRWVGSYDGVDRPSLVWSLEGSRTHIVLVVHDRRLDVGLEGAASSDPVAERAAIELLRQSLARVLAPVRPGAGLTATFALESAPSPRWAS